MLPAEAPKRVFFRHVGAAPPPCFRQGLLEKWCGKMLAAVNRGTRTSTGDPFQRTCCIRTNKPQTRTRIVHLTQGWYEIFSGIIYVLLWLTQNATHEVYGTTAPIRFTEPAKRASPQCLSRLSVAHARHVHEIEGVLRVVVHHEVVELLGLSGPLRRER